MIEPKIISSENSIVTEKRRATSKPESHERRSVSSKALTQEAVGGLAAGIVGTVIGYPLDLIKTRMQTGRAAVGGGGGAGILAAGTHIVRAEGIAAIYKGVGPPLVSLSILNTVNFAAYSYFHESFGASRGWDYRNAMAGAAIGPISSVVSTIENLLKTQMQVDNVSQKQFANSIACLKQITADHGITVVYTGHVINTAREMAFISTYFYVYEGLRKYLVNSVGAEKGWPIPVAGGCAGAVAWAVSFPLDCVRAGVQGRNLNSRRGSFQVLKKLLATKGVVGLYAGVGPSILRAFLVSGSRFSAYEGMLWLLRGGREHAP